MALTEPELDDFATHDECADAERDQFFEARGFQVVGRFVVLHNGWEMDNEGWITSDGQVWTTSHGGNPYPMTSQEVQAHIDETSSSFEGLIRAREAMKAIA